MDEETCSTDPDAPALPTYSPNSPNSPYQTYSPYNYRCVVVRDASAGITVP